MSDSGEIFFHGLEESCVSLSQESQDSIIFLGEYNAAEGNGEEDIEIAGALFDIAIADQNASRSMDSSATTAVPVPTARHDQTTLPWTSGTITQTPRPVWKISVVPCSASPHRFRPTGSTISQPEMNDNEAEASSSQARGSNPVSIESVTNNENHGPGPSTSRQNVQQEQRKSNPNGRESSSSDISRINRIETPGPSRATPIMPNKRLPPRRKLVPDKRKKRCSPERITPSQSSASTSATSAMVEPAVDGDENSQIVSIHRVSIETAKSEFGRAAEHSSEFELIQMIMRKANAKINEQSEDEKTKSVYERRENFQRPTLDDSIRHLFIGEDFSCDIYVQCVTNSYKFLLCFGLREIERSVNCIVFFYRQGDIYALTTRHAWNSVQWCSDFDFPFRFAARLLSTEGQIKSTEKELIGNVRVTSKTRKTCEGNNPLDIAKISTNFVADFRRNCSIFKFPCFSQGTDGETIRVEVGFGYIRILKRISNTDFLLILSHLAIVYSGGPTYFVDSDKIEQDSNAHAKNLMLVSNNLSQRLDTVLLKKIYNAFHNSGKAELDNFDFCHKYAEDYSIADKFYFFVGKKQVHTFTTHPTLSKIVDFMMSSEDASIKNLIKSRNFKDFKTKFIKFKIGYSSKGQVIAPEKILNFVEGDMVYENDGVYSKYVTRWCSVAPSYFAVVQFRFQDLLKKHLCNQSSLQLLKSWPSNAEIRRQKKADKNYNPVEEYVNLYADEENYYRFRLRKVIDLESEQENVKLFDLMKVGDNGEIYIYIIQDGFNARIRDASSQIKKALNKINKSNYCNTNTPPDSYYDFYNIDDPLKAFYEDCCDDTNFEKTYSEYFQFKADFKKAIFVFAVADPPDEVQTKRIETYFTRTDSTSQQGNTVRSFAKERDLPTKLDEKELFNLVQSFEEVQIDKFIDTLNLPCGSTVQSRLSAVSKQIYEVLREIKYVDHSGIVTSTLLLSTEKRFAFRGLDLECHADLRKAIYGIIRNYQSQYRYLIPKLELDMIRNEIVNAGFEFSICQIPINP